MMTAEVRLRPFRQEELHLYAQWMKDPLVLGPFVQPEHLTLEELEDDFAKDGWQSRRLRRWLLVFEDQEIMGFAHCWEFDPYEKHVEFGRIQLPAFRGRGLGTPVAQALLDVICAETEAHRIQSMTACGNIPVQRIWQNLGLTVDARLKEYMTLHGEYVDCFVASILRREWLQQRVSAV